MRTSIIAGAAIAAALAIAAPIAAPPAATRPAAEARDDLFAQIYSRGVARQRTLQSIRARFTETTVSSLLVRPLVAHGTVVAASPARVLMTYTDPEPKTVAMDGRSLIVVWSARGEREQIDISAVQKRIDHYFTHASIEELRSFFEISASPDSTLRQTYRVEMRPKRKQIKEGLDRLELWIERDSMLLLQMRMTLPGGDQKTIRLDDIAVNVPVTDDTFRVRPQ